MKVFCEIRSRPTGTPDGANEPTSSLCSSPHSPPWGAAWDEIRDPALAKKVLTGAAGAAAVALILRAVLGGPIGLLLTGASIASLVAFYVRNNRQVIAKVGGYREIIADYRERYQAITDEASDDATRHLMIDGLMSRFLDDLDAYEPQENESDARTGFQRHVDSKREEQD